jgi:glycosyltransferase involved in cell wall biosynthesis
MNIIFVRSNSISRGPSYDRAATSLSRNGHKVTYLGWDRDNKCSQKEYNGLYNIHRFKMRAPHGSFLLILYLPFWWLYEFYFLICNNEDVVHACDFDTLIPAVAAKFLKRTILCYTVYDFYADNLPAGTPSFIRRIVSSMEKFFIGFSDLTFLVSAAQKSQISNAKVKNLELIYNTPNDITNQIILPKSQNKSFLIFYAGELSFARGLNLLCKVVNELNDVKLVLAGSRIVEPDLKSIIENSQKIEYIGWISHSEVLEWTLKSAMSFAFYDPEVPNNRYGSPNKLFEAMMCAKPVIVNSESAAAKIVEECNNGMIVPFTDRDALKNAILKLKADPQLREILGNNGRKAYEEKYNWKLMENKLLNAYNNIIN